MPFDFTNTEPCLQDRIRSRHALALTSLRTAQERGIRHGERYLVMRDPCNQEEMFCALGLLAHDAPGLDPRRLIGQEEKITDWYCLFGATSGIMRRNDRYPGMTFSDIADRIEVTLGRQWESGTFSTENLRSRAYVLVATGVITPEESPMFFAPVAA